MSNLQQSIEKKKDDNHPVMYHQYIKCIERAIQINEELLSREFRQVEVIVYSGKTGTGKTRKAVEETEYITDDGDLYWWDGYDGEKSICIDQFSNRTRIYKLLRILDGYQLRLPAKNGNFT